MHVAHTRTLAQGSEVLLPLPSYMLAWVVALEGRATIGGDSAIDPAQEDAGAYAAGTGTFDLSAKPGKAAGRRMLGNMVASLSHTNFAYSGIGKSLLAAPCLC